MTKAINRDLCSVCDEDIYDDMTNRIGKLHFCVSCVIMHFPKALGRAIGEFAVHDDMDSIYTSAECQMTGAVKEMWQESFMVSDLVNRLCHEKEASEVKKDGAS